MNSITEQIGEMVGNNDLQNAINYLHKVLKNSPKLDDIIMQSARFTDIMKQIRLGLVDFEQANITKNQIRYGLLDLAREIEKCAEDNPEIIKDIEKKSLPTNISIQISTGSGDNIGRNKIVYQ